MHPAAQISFQKEQTQSSSRFTGVHCRQTSGDLCHPGVTQHAWQAPQVTQSTALERAEGSCTIPAADVGDCSFQATSSGVPPTEGVDTQSCASCKSSSVSHQALSDYPDKALNSALLLLVPEVQSWTCVGTVGTQDLPLPEPHQKAASCSHPTSSEPGHQEHQHSHTDTSARETGTMQPNELFRKALNSFKSYL